MAKNDAEPALTAAKMSAIFGFDVKLAPAVIVVLDAACMPERATSRAQRKMTHPFRQVGSLGDGVDIVLAVGPGAPVAAITVEFLAGFGVRQLIAVGTAGALTPHIGHDQSKLNVIAQAESDEGTSAHFGVELTADRELTASLLELAGGPGRTALTTDVPFRHTPERLAQHRARADVIEMECAALFAASRHFDVRAAAMLVTSDVFEDAHWRPLERGAVVESLHHAVRVATTALAPR